MSTDNTTLTSQNTTVTAPDPEDMAMLDRVVAVTGQAEAAQQDTCRRIGDSVTAMLGHALVVKATVPSAFPMRPRAPGRRGGAPRARHRRRRPARRTVGLDAAPRRFFPGG